MSATIGGVLLAAADLAEDQATTEGAVDAVLHFLACYPDAYSFLYSRLRTAGVVLADQPTPVLVADRIWRAAWDVAA